MKPARARIARFWCIVLSLACFWFLSGDPALAQPQAPPKPWIGDLNGMIERRAIRVLTVNSRTSYFVDKGVQRGIAVDYFAVFENELNKKLAAEKKLKDKNLKVRVVFIPVRRDQLLPELAAGKGDIAAANLTITPERQKLVDFSGAGLSNVREIVVDGLLPELPAAAGTRVVRGERQQRLVELRHRTDLTRSGASSTLASPYRSKNDLPGHLTFRLARDRGECARWSSCGD